jgi:hypothetical protein
MKVVNSQSMPGNRRYDRGHPESITIIPLIAIIPSFPSADMSGDVPAPAEGIIANASEERLT